MEKIKEIVRKGLCGGAIIGFGGVAFLLSPDKIIGAILFAIGLVSVIIFQANLFIDNPFDYFSSFRPKNFFN